MAQTPFKARLGLETPTGQDVNSGGDIKINGVSINTGGTLDNVFYLDTQDMDDVADGATYVKTENNLTDSLKTNYDSAYTHSTITTGNPHSVTKTDVGLENVVNVDTSNPANITWTENYRTVTDTEKTTWNDKVNSSDIVTTATANKILKLDENAKLPASITGNADGNSATATKLQTAKKINGVSFDGSADITINAVDSTARIASSEKGAINGVATLDGAGKIPSSQLPNYAVSYITKSKSSTYTALITDDCIFCTNTWTLSLPVANTWTKPLTVKNIGTGVITIDANGSETIDGELTRILTENMYVVLMSDGTNIHRIGG